MCPSGQDKGFLSVAARAVLVGVYSITMAGVDMHAVLQRTEQLYHENKFREAFEILEKYRESDDPDVLWQVVRIYYRIGKHETPDQTEAKKIADTAMEIAEKALKINDKHFLCQKVS